MASNFKFLETEFPVLANFGNLAEQYCYTDPNSCLMKLGMIGETIVNLMFTYDKIPAPYDNSASNRINVLSSEGLLTRDLTDILHALRKVRNKAVHENYAEASDCPVFLQMTYSLSEWFMQTYGDWNYQHRDFVMPVKEEKKTEKIVVFNKAQEEEKEEELTKAAIACAEQSEQIDKKVRLKQANKMASQRQKSEAETRYMIDEQLRQVGWEANTQEIRYSKGARPAKGHNMAIAEWPTDSTVSKKGYADYALFVGIKLVGIIEAKAEHKDIPSVIDYQGKDYPRNIRKEDAEYLIGTWGEFKVPFTFATNGRPYLEQFKTKSGIWFLDLREPSNVPTALHGWISPDGIMELLASILKNLPDAVSLGIVWGIMAIGVYITFKVLDIADMTVDGTFAMGGCIVASTVASGWNPIFSTLFAILCGMAAGLVTGILHTKLKIPAILAGILTMLSLYSVDLMILGGKSNIGMSQFGENRVYTILDKLAAVLGTTAKTTNIITGIVLAVVIVMGLYWFFGTEQGCLIRATGINEAMVKAQGGNTDTMKIIGLIIANGFVSLSGALVSQIQRYGDVGMGTGTIVIGLASIIIGEVIFGTKCSFKVRLASVFFGSIIYRVIIAIVLLLGFNPNNLKLLTAMLVIAALSVPVIRGYIFERKRIRANMKKYEEVETDAGA